METYQHISRFGTPVQAAEAMPIWLGCPAAAVAAFAFDGSGFG
jgi:hypothetical protein